MTKTQLRATCPACFAVQALRSGCLVEHGYRRPQDWHQNVGTCNGTGQPHFGTKAGRDYTAFIAGRLRVQADNVEQEAVAVVTENAPVLATKRVAFGVNSEVVVDNPTARDREQYAARLRQRAGNMRKQAVEYDALAAGWVPTEPVAVTVETKTALLHWRTQQRWHGGKACAGSAMAAHKGAMTSETENVTCPKCRALIATLRTRSA